MKKIGFIGAYDKTDLILYVAKAAVEVGKTVLVIAHRLHTIMNADKICVIKQGELVAEGRHEELLQSSEEYKRLWNAAKESMEWEVRA